jgi:acetoin utilization protein AcuB
MIVRDYMTRHPLMAEPTMPITEAQSYMGENMIRHLPIIGKGKRLVGLITRERLLVDPGRLGSLDVWDIARTLTSLTVGDVMLKADEVVTIDPEATIEQAARELVKHGIGCLPVVEDGIVVGIINNTDLLAQLTEMMAVQPPVPYTRVTMRMPNVPGELAKLVAAIAAQGWGILTLAGALYPKDTDRWDVVVKLSFVTGEEAVAVLGQVEGCEILDVRDA